MLRPVRRLSKVSVSSMVKGAGGGGGRGEDRAASAPGSASCLVLSDTTSH